MAPTQVYGPIERNNNFLQIMILPCNENVLKTACNNATLKITHIEKAGDNLDYSNK